MSVDKDVVAALLAALVWLAYLVPSRWTRSRR